MYFKSKYHYSNPFHHRCHHHHSSSYLCILISSQIFNIHTFLQFFVKTRRTTIKKRDTFIINIEKQQQTLVSTAASPKLSLFNFRQSSVIFFVFQSVLSFPFSTFLQLCLFCFTIVHNMMQHPQRV